ISRFLLHSTSGRTPHPHPFPTRRSSDLSSPKPKANPDIMTDRRNEDSAAGVYRRLIRYAGEYKLIFLLAGLAMLLGALGEGATRSEEHTSELQSRENLVCRLLLETKNIL